MHTTYYSGRINYIARTTHYAPVTTYYALRTTYYALLTTYHLLRTTYYALLGARTVKTTDVFDPLIVDTSVDVMLLKESLSGKLKTQQAHPFVTSP